MGEIFWEWLKEHAIEVFGAITGILYLIFSVVQSIWLWILGLITSVVYTYVFFFSGLYADMGLQVYYVVISIYGWYYWKFGIKDKNTTRLPVSRLTFRLGLSLFVVSLLLYVVIVLLLLYVPENLGIDKSSLPYLDAFTTAASIVATWMLARKILEHWIAWIVIDSISAGMYIYKGLYPTTALFIVYTVFAFVGYFSWKKSNMIKIA